MFKAMREWLQNTPDQSKLWNMSYKKAIEKYGSGIEVLKEYNKDTNIALGCTAPDIIQSTAILELETKIAELEKRLNKIDPLGLTKSKE